MEKYYLLKEMLAGVKYHKYFMEIEEIYKAHPELLEGFAEWLFDLTLRVGTNGLDAQFYLFSRRESIFKKLEGGSLSEIDPKKIVTAMGCLLDLYDRCENFEQVKKLVSLEVPGVDLEMRIGGGAFSDVYVGRRQMAGGVGSLAAVKVFKHKDEIKSDRAREIYDSAEPVKEAKVVFEKLMGGHNFDPIKGIPVFWDFKNCSLWGKDYYALVMQYIRGVDLKTFWENKGFPGVHQERENYYDSVGVLEGQFGQLCHILGALHSRSLLHRDLHMENILVDENDPKRVYLVDFGLIASLDFGAVGKRAVLSPQAVKDPRAYDKQDEIYALGVNMYWIMTGTFPFFDGVPSGTADYEEMNRRKLTEKARPPREINPRVPEKLEKAVLKCLESDKRMRYREVYDFGKDVTGSYFPYKMPAL